MKLRKTALIVNFFRPAYTVFLNLAFPRGVKRVINGTDEVIVSPEYRNMSEVFEAAVWSRIMDKAREGDVVIDVGAFIGLYTVSLAKKVGNAGRVYAFEMDKTNLAALQKHIRLNGLGNAVTIYAAAGDTNSLSVSYEPHGEESYIVSSEMACETKYKKIQTKSLDKTFSDIKIDIIKIDVEGYEEKVLLGARSLLSRKDGYPRAIFIETHPYMWHFHNTSADKILRLLGEAGYRVEDIRGEPVDDIKNYSEIIALKD
ncbi:MAG: FkbM family methyltransferase [Candidatus Omnitrophota bacterium]